jgi:hypothetical protein
MPPGEGDHDRIREFMGTAVAKGKGAKEPPEENRANDSQRRLRVQTREHQRLKNG